MGANNFVVLPTIPIGAATGPQPAVDLWALVPDTGINPGFTAICAGIFQGSIFLEGSLNGVNFAPIGIQPDQALNLGLSAAQLGAPSSFSLGLRSSANQAPSAFELTPLIIPNVVRYVRANIAPGTLVTGPVSITLGGEQNCACSAGLGLDLDFRRSGKGSLAAFSVVATQSVAPPFYGTVPCTAQLGNSRLPVGVTQGIQSGTVGCKLKYPGQVTKILCDPGLTFSLSNQLFSSEVGTGTATNLPPSTSGSYVIYLGFVIDFSSYALDSTVLAFFFPYVATQVP